MNIRMIDTYALTKSNFMQMESGIPELENLVEKPSYALWRHKTDQIQIVTS